MAIHWHGDLFVPFWHGVFGSYDDVIAVRLRPRFKRTTTALRCAKQHPERTLSDNFVDKST